jgi:hypothetical protein
VFCKNPILVPFTEDIYATSLFYLKDEKILLSSCRLIAGLQILPACFIPLEKRFLEENDFHPLT